MNIRSDILSLQEKLTATRRDFHAHPELAFEETRTAGIVAERLRDLGLEVTTGLARTGVVGILEGSGDGPCIGLRADMDALPLDEDNEVPYRSTHPGKMHACGHDGHVAILLGAAEILASMRDRFRGKVKFLFQPAEEGHGGAQRMVEAGVLKNPDVDKIFGLHLWNYLPLGMIGLRPGPMMASTDEFVIRIEGNGGHAAAPHLAIDALLVGAQIVNALQTIISRSIDPQQPLVVGVGEFKSGTAFNIIAEKALLRGTVRAFDDGVRRSVHQRIKELANNICRAYWAKAEVEYEYGYPVTVNDDEMAAFVKEIAQAVVDPANVIAPDPIMGSEDMSYYLKEVPGCFFFLGSSNGERGLYQQHHNPRFDFDETVLPLGVEMFVRIIEKLLV